MTVADLPGINAGLNTLSSLFLLAGYVLIRRGQAAGHRFCMIGALVTSALFLVSYLLYHSQAGRTVFSEPAWFRPIYLAILLSHSVLAMLIVPLVMITVTRAFRRQFDRHRRIARWTWPLWMYVSGTGVLIYLLLYHVFP